jgi:hypothetical protein
MRRPVAFALVLALALAGCGASNDSATDFDGADQEVAEAVEDLEEAAQEDEPRRICEALLAKSVTDRLGADCEKRIQEAIDGTDTFALTVEDVTIQGTKATVKVETGLDEEQVETIELVREGAGEAAAWKIERLP